MRGKGEPDPQHSRPALAQSISDFERKIRLRSFLVWLVEREQRPRFISSLHGLYEKPRYSRRLLNAFVLPTNRAGPKATLARAPALNNI